VTNNQPLASVASAAKSPVPAAVAFEVNISATLALVEVMHHGRKVTIMRNQ